MSRPWFARPHVLRPALVSAAFAALLAAPASAATLLRFAPGTYGLTVNGRVTSKVFQRTYAIQVRAGQTVILSFTGAGAMRGSISCKGGGDGPYYGAGNSFIVPASGPCLLNVGANTMAEPWTGGFTMAVLVTNR